VSLGMAARAYPRSLREFQRLFPDEESCVRYLFALRWPYDARGLGESIHP